MQCEHHYRANFYRAKARLRGCVVTRLGDAILNLSQVNSQKLKFNLVCQFRVNKVFGQIFQPVENSSLPCERSLKSKTTTLTCITLFVHFFSVNARLSRENSEIRHLHFSHNAPYLPPKILHKRCFQFLLRRL